MDLFGDVQVAMGEFIKDPDGYPARAVRWRTWLDGEVRLIAWHEPGESKTRWFLKLPKLLLVPATVAVPLVRATIWLVLFRRFLHRLRRGECGRCGYDLRGSAGGCPECGEAAAARPAG